MKKIIFLVLILAATLTTYSQVAVNTDNSLPDNSAMLDVKSDTAGVLIPRMTTTQRDAISSPANGLLVYVTTDSTFYYYDNNNWVKILNENNTDEDWVVNGNHMSSAVSGSVGIGTSNPDTVAALDVSDTTKGVLFPRLTTLQLLAIDNPVDGLIAYVTDSCKFFVYRGCSSIWTEVALGQSTIAPVFYCGSSDLVDTRDGTHYETVQIGTQCWMAENLNIGQMILSNNNQTDNNIIEKYCYDNDDTNCIIYGGLYKWREANQYWHFGAQGVCPDGWHLPSIDEYDALINFLGGSGIAGGKMKETGTTHWNTPNTGATNSSGFTGFAGGYSSGSSFLQLLNYGYYNTRNGYYDGPMYKRLNYNNDDVSQNGSSVDNMGLSVRCIKD